MNLSVLTWRFYLLHIFFLNATLLSGQSTWTNPIIKQGYLGSPLVETSTFVFKNRLYLLENNQRFWDVPGAKPGDFFHQDEVRIRDVKAMLRMSSCVIIMERQFFISPEAIRPPLVICNGQHMAERRSNYLNIFTCQNKQNITMDVVIEIIKYRTYQTQQQINAAV